MMDGMEGYGGGEHWKTVVVFTEKLQLELGTCPLPNSYEPRSNHQFLLEVRDVPWCEMWPS